MPGFEQAGGETLRLMPWEKNGRVQWFEASGVGKAQGLLQRPVPGVVSSDFGRRRHPILGYTRMHKGVDFRAGYGTPILAATDGVIAAAGWAGGYGKQVRINHGGGITTSYSHMSRIVGEPGTPVRQGQLIGYVGSTGMSTGPASSLRAARERRRGRPGIGAICDAIAAERGGAGSVPIAPAVSPRDPPGRAAGERRRRSRLRALTCLAGHGAPA
jgi:hypothetical protein